MTGDANMAIDCGGDDTWEGRIPNYSGTVCGEDLTGGDRGRHTLQ